MLLGFLGAFTTTALAVAYGSWPIYAIPFIAVSIIGWLSMRNRSDNGAEHDDKDFRNSSTALDTLVTEFNRAKKENDD
jgi:hypothetical protein